VRPLRTTGRRDAGFTLIELVISSALMAIILAAAYAVLSACVSGQKLIEPRLEVVQNARVALGIMTADLRAACPLSRDYDLLGVHRMLGDIQADSLDFATHNHTPSRPRQGDYAQESFFVDKDAENGQLCLWRRRNPTLAFDPLSGGTREEIARGVRGLRFEYYDGIDWYDDWGEQDQRKQQTSLRAKGNLSGMPEAVRITLWLDPNPKAKPADPKDKDNAEPPLVFQTVARLNLAGASSGGASGADPADTPATPGALGTPAGPSRRGGGG
jgi:prepilin-type N-terminal cleavage/methylation domain-containing protein